MKRLSPDQKMQVAVLREERGLSYGQIAARFGVSSSAVQYHCITAGALSPRRRPAFSRGPRLVRCRDGWVIRRFTADEDALLLALAAEGLGAKAIALHEDGLTAHPLPEESQPDEPDPSAEPVN